MTKENDIIAIPPGATIREQLIDRRMKQKEFAARMGLSEKHVSHLLNGKVELTQDVALRLEVVLGIPAGFWNNLEAIYREKIERLNDSNFPDSEWEIASRFPYAKMAKSGWVKTTREKKQKVMELRRFFEVARLDYLGDRQLSGIACRKLGSNDSSDYSLIAWTQKVCIEARKIKCGPLNISKLETWIPELRKMTTWTPDKFCRVLSSTAAGYGLAIVFLPHIDGSYLHGATFRDGSRAVMGLTVRGKDADKFWFSLFHELYHIISGSRTSGQNALTDEESAADNFARDTLMPPDQYHKLIQQPLSEQRIVRFAQDIGIAPGIVVGRLQKEQVIPYTRYNQLKERYALRESVEGSM